MRSRTAPLDGRPSLARGGSLIAPALTVVNLAGYVLTVAAARAFDHDAYGRFGALLAVLLVVSVPGLAVQSVVARSVAARGRRDPAYERALVQRALLVGIAASCVIAAASPLVAAFLHTGIAGPLWVAAQVAPLTMLSAGMGLLQGAERFRALALVLGGQALGKAVGLVPLAVGGGVTDVLAALTVGAAGSAVLALVVAGPDVLHGSRERGTALPTLRDLGLAAAGLLTVLVLSNVDLLLARHLLSGDQSGRYSVGAVLAKVAFWLPQAVAVVIFPRLAEEGGRELLRRALLLVAGLGGVEVLGCLLLARPVLELTFGTSYGSLAPIAWLWVLQGVGLSLVQLFVYRAIATRDGGTGKLIGAAAGLEAAVLLVLSPNRPGAIAGVAAATLVLLTLVLITRAFSGPLRPRSDPHPR